MAKTQIPDVDAKEWAERYLVPTYPEPWTDSEERQEGGLLYSLFKSIGVDLEHLDDQIQYAFKTTRVETAIDVGLDSVAKDFFDEIAGYPADVERTPGEPDESLRARIKGALLLPAATRESMIQLIERLTGETPRVMEPWSPGDTATWDNVSFFDIDTPENSARYGDNALRYQGFLEATLPSFGDQGDNPVYAFDKGACWDAPSGYFIDPKPTWWLSSKRLDALVNKTKQYGTTVWRKYRGVALTKVPIGGNYPVPLNSGEVTIELFPPLAGLFSVIGVANWNTGISFIQQNGNDKITLRFSVQAPADAMVSFYAAPITVGGNGIVPASTGATQITVGILSEFQDKQCFIMPSWTTDFWVHSRTDSNITFRFSNEAPAQSTVGYAFMPYSNVVNVDEGVASTVVPLSTRDPFQAFVVPNWNTTYEVIKTPNFLTVNYANPAPSGALLYWGVNES